MVHILGKDESFKSSCNESKASEAISKLEYLQIRMKVSEMPVGHKQFTEIAQEIDRENVRLLVLTNLRLF